MGDRPDLPVYTFAQLANAKIVIESPKQQYFVVDKFFFRNCMRMITTRVPFDEEWYIKKYPDVAQAVTKGAVSSAHEHYIQHGYFEHRLPFRITVDGEWYLKQHPDVGEAVEKRLFSSAQHHFEIVGFREGRLPFPGFEITANAA